MSRKSKNILTIATCIAIVLTLFVVSSLAGRVTMNPAGTIGNSGGNLNNGGLFCEYDGMVYFANAFDGGSLYSMDVTEGNIKKLNEANSHNILAGGDYLYYFQLGSSGEAGLGNVLNVRSFNRCNLRGKNTVTLSRDTVVTAQLVDNYLYMLTAGSDHPEFYKMKIDKSEQTALADYQINPASAANGIIYYNGTGTDHYLYALDTATDSASVLWRGNIWYPIVSGDYVYYLDVAENYRLCRYSFSQDAIEVLTSDRVDCFNVNNGYIYYQKNGTAPQLKCMRLDGTAVTVIADGNYTNINMTSQYVYFQAFGDETQIYHTLLGSGTYSLFTAARDAIPQ